METFLRELRKSHFAQNAWRTAVYRVPLKVTHWCSNIAGIS